MYAQTCVGLLCCVSSGSIVAVVASRGTLSGRPLPGRCVTETLRRDAKCLGHSHCQSVAHPASVVGVSLWMDHWILREHSHLSSFSAERALVGCSRLHDKYIYSFLPYAVATKGRVVVTGKRRRRKLTLRLLMSYIFGAPSKARNANVVYIWTYVWQR